jgi:1,4-alpha-glucan branching enzyme
MKEKRRGPIGRAAGLAEGVAATVRRMQREREPRVLVYDETGYARLVQPNGRGYERLQETAERMVALVDQAEADAKPRRARRIDESGGAQPRGTAGADGQQRAEGRSTGADETKPRGTGRAAGAKPRRAQRAKGAKDTKTGRAQRAKGAKDAKPGRARSAGSADEPAKPRRARRSAREGDA